MPKSQPASRPAPAQFHFLTPGAIDLAHVLPEPPQPGSLAGQADLETVLRMQASRTPEQIEWARIVDRDTVFNHASIFGAWFTKENLPRTAQLFREIGEDMGRVSGPSKAMFSRQRPPLVNSEVHPCVGYSGFSYPSGHSIQSFVWAGVLSELFPEKRAELFERAHRAAWSRIIAGVHFPSDDVGGRRLAEAIVEELLKSPTFRAALESCRVELQPFLVKKAA